MKLVKKLAYLDEIQRELNKNASNKSNLTAGLILQDSEYKETNKWIINDLKNNITIR